MADQRFDPKQLGRRGEDRALKWYLDRGYELIERNWRCRAGEIDLIVSTCDAVVFVEVKTRTSARHGTPFEAVGPAKQRRLRQLAAIWLSANPCRGRRSVRFDVAAVVGAGVDVRRNAF